MPARGESSRGKRVAARGRGSKPQRGSRRVPTEEEVLARNAAPSPSEESEDSEDETQPQSQQQRKGPVMLAESDEDEQLVGAGNPNRNPTAFDGPRELTRREREAIEKAKQAALMQKLQAEGKTSRAKADLARLAEVRRRREEAERARAGLSP